VTTAAHWHRRRGAATSGRIVIFDIDGVLSDARPRQHHLREGAPDWHAFFSAGINDKPLTAGVALARAIALPNVMVSARPSYVHDDSVAWLEREGVPFDLVITRPEGDRTSSSEFKAAELAALQHAGYEVMLAVDDDPENVAMYHERGIEALYIHSGYYDIELGIDFDQGSRSVP